MLFIYGTAIQKLSTETKISNRHRRNIQIATTNAMSGHVTECCRGDVSARLSQMHEHLWHCPGLHVEARLREQRWTCERLMWGQCCAVILAVMWSRIAGILFGVAVSLTMAVIVSQFWLPSLPPCTSLLHLWAFVVHEPQHTYWGNRAPFSRLRNYSRYTEWIFSVWPGLGPLNFDSLRI